MKTKSQSLPIRSVCVASLCALLLLRGPAPAVIPEPDNILYGSITLDNTLVTSARTDVVIEARRQTNGPAIASYRMGSDTTLGDFYALRMTIESVTPLADTNAAQIADSLFVVVTDGTGLRAQTTYTVTERGVAQRVDFGVAALDSDGDGLPDAWELQHFTNLGQSTNSLGANGQTAWQNYLAGADPNDPGSGFRLAIAGTNNPDRVLVSFFTVQAQGAGYEGRQRYYALETSTDPGGGWAVVPGYSNIAGNDQVLVHSSPNTSPARFYRSRVWLQP